jgi:transcriptional regulator with XRE-family HTH domain
MTQIDQGIGGRIAEARAAAGLTQTELAARIGHAARTVQAWESNDRHPRMDALRQLALALGQDVAWFYSEPDAPVDTSRAA